MKMNVGWVFCMFGTGVFLLALHVGIMKDTNFIYDEEVFRVSLIGICFFLTGMIIIHIKENKAQHSHESESKK